MMRVLRAVPFLVILYVPEAYRTQTAADIGGLELEALQDEQTFTKMEGELEVALEDQWSERFFVEMNAIASSASRNVYLNGMVARRRRTRRGGSVFDGGAPSCPDKPECEEALSSGELTCEGPDLQPGDSVNESHAQFLCPTSCATMYERSHCIQHQSGCRINNPCRGGWRPVANCTVPWELGWQDNRRLTYTCERDDGDARAEDPWCPSAVNPSEKVPCDECTESMGPRSEAELWEPVAAKLRCLEVALTAGDARGPRFEFENRGQTLSEVRMSGSIGKWPSSVALAMTVRDGHLDWDTLASEVFTWWTSDPADARSRVSFRHLLNFASGFYISNDGNGSMHWTHSGWSQRCLTNPYARLYSPEQCARQIYDTAEFTGEPGVHPDYNSYHLQIALAMAVERTGMGARDLLRKNLFEPAGMIETSWSGGANPVLAYGISTNAVDYGRFLRAYLANELLPKEYTDVMETESWNTTGVSLEYNSMEDIHSWAMGNQLKYSEGHLHHCMGGVFKACISRESDTYFVLAPPTSDYFFPGSPISWGYSWIINDVDVAITASRGNE